MNLLLSVAMVMVGLWVTSSAYYTKIYQRPRYTAYQKAMISKILNGWKEAKNHHVPTPMQKAYLNSLDSKQPVCTRQCVLHD